MLVLAYLRYHLASICFPDFTPPLHITQQGHFNKSNNLSIVINSLYYIDEEKSYNTVVIDEIESVLDGFVGDFII
jgi:hypothetical protein